MASDIYQSSEEWRSVSGYEGYLEVSNLGRVRSLDRHIPRSDTGRPVFYSGKVLAAPLDKGGYPRLRLSFGAVKVNIRVHRLVAEAFIPNIENKPQVNHISGVKTDNRAVNLEWSTNAENQSHAVATGLKVAKKGRASARFERGVDVYKDGEYIRTVCGNEEMSQHGLDFRLVSACLKGKRHTHKGFSFKIHKEAE